MNTWIPEWIQNGVQGKLLAEQDYHEPSEYINEPSKPGPDKLAPVIVMPDSTHIPPNPKPYKLTSDRRFVFGGTWIQNIIKGTVRDEQKLRAHAESLGISHLTMDFRTLLVNMSQYFREDLK